MNIDGQKEYDYQRLPSAQDHVPKKLSPYRTADRKDG